MTPKNKKCDVSVTGDTYVDWMFETSDGENIELTLKRGGAVKTKALYRISGAYLLEELIGKMVKTQPIKDKVFVVKGPQIGGKTEKDIISAFPGKQEITKTYSTLKEFNKVLRIDKLWGVEIVPSKQENSLSRENEIPDFLVIEDFDYGFRNTPENWPNWLKKKKDDKKLKAIILKTVYPLAEESELWETLISEYGDKLIVVTSLDQLRKGASYVGGPRSWEQMYEELDQAIKESKLAKAATIIAAIKTSGAVLVEGNRSYLIFDPVSQENDWEEDHPGQMTGYGTCLTVSIAHEMMKNPESHSFIRAIKQGLSLTRTLHEYGYQKIGGEQKKDDDDHKLYFPIKIMCKEMEKGSDIFSDLFLYRKPGTPQNILEDQLKNTEAGLIDTAKAVVKKGPRDALPNVPIDTYGGWSSIDRMEIESLRSICNIMKEYTNQFTSAKFPDKPLSIAVFGPPGSGKSFAIKQIAKSLWKKVIEKREFNLSQFETVEELHEAFYRIRDLTLDNKLPLVFWDEFDSSFAGSHHGWLQYFLAPMQDGRFLSNGISHPIGPAIFIFAGSTSPTIADFNNSINEKGSGRDKKPDFLSRLRGFVDILGPNKLDHEDKYYMFRRALILRGLLSKEEGFRREYTDAEKVKHKEKYCLRVDDGVLNAFLGIDRFFHGARSVQAIIDMSSLTGRTSYESSCLPAKHQLDLHVDSDLFTSLVKQSTGCEPIHTKADAA